MEVLRWLALRRAGYKWVNNNLEKQGSQNSYKGETCACTGFPCCYVRM